MRKIALYGGDDNPALLHADGHLPEIGEKALAFIVAEIEKLNPGASADREVCGGCVNTIIYNLHECVLERAGASRTDAASYYRSKAARFQRRAATLMTAGSDAFGDLLAALFGKTTVFEAELADAD